MEAEWGNVPRRGTTAIIVINTDLVRVVGC
jgi:hypothetical protein